jgi:hypothetical protein
MLVSKKIQWNFGQILWNLVISVVAEIVAIPK